MTLFVRAAGVYRPVAIDNLFQRSEGVYSKVSELKVKSSGGYRSAWRENVAPPAPINLFSTAEGGGVINVYWAWATNPDDDYSRVEVQEVGDVARIPTDYPEVYQRRTGYTEGQGVYMQVRTIDHAGLASPWGTIGGVTARYSHPGIATMTGVGWNGTAFVVNWTAGDNAYGDPTDARLMCKTQAESTWTQVGPPLATSAGQPHSVIAPVRTWDANHFFYVQTMTSWAMTNSIAVNRWAPPVTGTEKTITPYSADSYAFTPNIWLNDGKVRQGQFSPTPHGLHFGMFFYDDLLYNASHGHPAVSGDIFMIREGEQGFPGTVFFEGHAYRSRPSATPTGSGVTWPSTNQFTGADASAFEALPASFLQSVAVGTTKGVGIYTASEAQTNYKVFKGPSTHGSAGMIRLRW